MQLMPFSALENCQKRLPNAVGVQIGYYHMAGKIKCECENGVNTKMEHGLDAKTGIQCKIGALDFVQFCEVGGR